MFDSVLNTLLGTFWKYELVCRSFQINLKCLVNVLILWFGWLSAQATRPEYTVQIAKVGLCKFVVEGLKC